WVRVPARSPSKTGILEVLPGFEISAVSALCLQNSCGASALVVMVSPMAEPKHLATVRDYDELVAAVRARVAELNITHANVDDVSGVPGGYASKLLCNPPMRTMGRVSLGLMLGALGLKLLVVEDE